MSVHDVIVIGGGPVGLATAYYLSKRDDVKSVVVLERFKFGNQDGASAGISRQFRIPYPQEYMVQLAVDAQKYWGEIQKHTDQVLLDKVGTLWFGNPEVQSPEGNIKGARVAMQSVKPPVPFDDLTAKEVESKYNFQNIPEKYVGIFQKDGASINIPGTVDVLLKLVKESKKVQLIQEYRVSFLKHVGDRWFVASGGSSEYFQGKKLVIVPGPYMNEILNLINITIDATYWEMTSCYFKKTKKDINYPTWIIFQKNSIDQYYGFPEESKDIPGGHPGYIRVSPDFCLKPLKNPENRTHTPNPTELKYTEDFVRKNMTFLEPKAMYTSTCLVALSNDQTKEFILDFAPEFNKSVVFCATGWVAKFIPLLGFILSELAITGTTHYDLSPFKLSNPEKQQYVRKLVSHL